MDATSLSLAVIGLGAVGGSLAWQARLAGLTRVVGYSAARPDGIQALKADAITELADHPARAVRGADLVILATPPAATLQLIGELAPILERGTVLTDVCSVKGSIVRRAKDVGMADRFAGGHPLAGTHGSGFPAARPDRFRGCVVYICETGTPGGAEAARRVAGFWERVIGAAPVFIDADAHDRQLAWTSHLPQAVSSALANALADRGLAGVSFGTGARDTTRLAGSSPELWVDVLLENGPAIAEAIDAAGQRLQALRDLIVRRDAAGLRDFLAAGQRFRQGIER